MKIDNIFTKLATLLLLTFLTLLGGCASIQMSIRPGPDKNVQLTAEQHFLNGDFPAALLDFEQIYENALVPEDRVVALYGLACTQMMLAQTEAELATAIKNLQKWDAMKGSSPFIENHHLLVLALKRQAEIIHAKQLEAAENEGRKNRLIATQKNKISQMAATMETLKKQLEELETIDETIQQKRKL